MQLNGQNEMENSDINVRIVGSTLRQLILLLASQIDLYGSKNGYLKDGL